MNGSNRDGACVHCWHESGMGSSFGFGGGTEAMRCCRCGSDGVREWRVEREPYEGHGPYWTREVKRYSATKPALGYRVISGNSTPPDASVPDTAQP